MSFKSYGTSYTKDESWKRGNTICLIIFPVIELTECLIDIPFVTPISSCYSSYAKDRSVKGGGGGQNIIAIIF